MKYPFIFGNRSNYWNTVDHRSCLIWCRATTKVSACGGSCSRTSSKKSDHTLLLHFTSEWWTEEHKRRLTLLLLGACRKELERKFKELFKDDTFS
ncbi:hypothetical protein AVEN_17920-1 [Araneus ventricosus]|uniref:Uncharacterized protein n=1 Tax=Araneus ventricosus TaxID=182803 RepID=A0A4Y2FYB8_ARAVE|nr:hypothetical protein AVEN_17920-1 [Araneus ventricosus]